jgi:hypothetical protein
MQPEYPPDLQMYRIATVCRMLDQCRSTINNHIKAKRLDARKVEGAVLITAVSVKRLLGLKESA